MNTDENTQNITLIFLKNRRIISDIKFFYKLLSEMIDAPKIIQEFKFYIPMK